MQTGVVINHSQVCPNQAELMKVSGKVISSSAATVKACQQQRVMRSLSILLFMVGSCGYWWSEHSLQERFLKT